MSEAAKRANHTTDDLITSMNYNLLDLWIKNARTRRKKRTMEGVEEDERKRKRRPRMRRRRNRTTRKQERKGVR